MRPTLPVPFKKDAVTTSLEVTEWECLWTMIDSIIEIALMDVTVYPQWLETAFCLFWMHFCGIGHHLDDSGHPRTNHRIRTYVELCYIPKSRLNKDT